jgi:hypothetical protein
MGFVNQGFDGRTDSHRIHLSKVPAMDGEAASVFIKAPSESVIMLYLYQRTQNCRNLGG